MLCRRALGLKPIKTFAQLTPDHDLAVTLEVLYKDINNVDAYIGGLAEPHYQKAHVGELFYFSILDQFKRLRDGDWWYYENKDNGLFSSAEIAEVQRTSEWNFIIDIYGPCQLSSSCKKNQVVGEYRMCIALAA